MTSTNDVVEAGAVDLYGLSAPAVRLGRERRVAVMVALAALLIGAWAWEPLPSGLWHDDGAYLLLAKSLAEGDGLRYAGVPDTPPGAKFPPVYPVTLALAWRLAPDAMAGGAGGGALNVLIFAVAAGLMWLYTRTELRLGLAAAGVTLLPWLSPDLWRLGMVSLSEPLFILLLLSTLWAVTRALRVRRRGAVVGAAILLVLLTLTRSIGVVVIGAALATFAVERRWRDVGWMLGLVVAGLVPWSVWAGVASGAMAAPLRELMGSYSAWLGGQAGTDPLALVGRALAVTPIFSRIGLSLFLPGATGIWPWVMGPIGVAATLAGLIALGQKGRVVWLTLLFYLALIWVWPHTERRLLAPLLPILLIGVAACMQMASQLPTRIGRWVRGGVVSWAALFAVAGIVGLSREIHLDAYRIRHRMLAPALTAIQTAVPEDGVVGAPEFWSAIFLHTGRLSAPSARFLPLGTQTWGTPAQQFELWAATHTRYLLLERNGVVHAEALNDLDRRCPGSVRVLANWAGGRLIELLWDDRCKTTLGLSVPR